MSVWPKQVVSPNANGCVTDLRMSAFHGNFFVRSTDLLAMPSVPQDLSYAIEIQIEDNITAPFVVLQTAVLHTTCYGSSISAPRNREPFV